MSDFKASPPKKDYYLMEVVKDKSYYWCSCGKSAKLPFCDGAHTGTDFLPVRYVASKTKDVYFCGCRNSKNGAICDGSHKE